MRSRYSVLTAAALSAALMLVSAQPAAAHHSFAMFDNTKCLTVSGTVRNFTFNYPHIWLWMVVPDDKGKEDVWGFEGATPSEHKRYSNWNKNSLKPGEKITLQYIPLRDGRHGGSLQNITKADGSTLKSPMQMCGHPLRPKFGDAPVGPPTAPAKQDTP